MKRNAPVIPGHFHVKIHTMNSELLNIIIRLESILQNSQNEPADMLGSYIVGATLVRDDIKQYFNEYPLLERVAELGADLETLGGSPYADEVLAEIQQQFDALKKQISAKK